MAEANAAALLNAYLDTVYTVEQPGGGCTFRVGEPLPFVVPAAYLTGWNPHSRPRSPGDNERANAALATMLRAHGGELLPARSAAADGSHGEAGWLALGIDAVAIDACARAFGQNAAVHALPGAVARLRCYGANLGCPEPPSGVDTRFVDWLP